MGCLGPSPSLPIYSTLSVILAMMGGGQVHRLICLQAIWDGMCGEGYGNLILDRISQRDSILEYEETWGGREGKIILNVTPDSLSGKILR